jgi:hypothetical protein
MAAIEADPSDACRQMDDDLGSVHGSTSSAGVSQVVVTRADDAHLSAQLVEIAHNHRAEETGTAGYRYAAVLPVGRVRPGHH